MVTLLTLALILGARWGITVGIIYLICLCFDWHFSLLIATGIWLITVLIKITFGRSKKEDA